jgi:hypothetical protein
MLHGGGNHHDLRFLAAGQLEDQIANAIGQIVVRAANQH